jgi:regulator of RNase E activity RraA
MQERKAFATTTVSDALDSLGIKSRVVAGLQPIRPNQRARGIARVGIVVESDAPGIDGLSELLDGAAEGDFLMIAWAAQHKASVFGGLAAQRARLRGCVGLAVDGCVRDLDELAERLPVWYETATPKTGRGRLGVRVVDHPVIFGGVQVITGDTVFADETGICVVPSADVARVVKAALAIEQNDLDSERKLLEGGSWIGSQPTLSSSPAK